MNCKISLPRERKHYHRPRHNGRRKHASINRWFIDGPLSRDESLGQRQQSPIRTWKEMTPEERMAILERLRVRG